jgi:hypothetical protein
MAEAMGKIQTLRGRAADKEALQSAINQRTNVDNLRKEELYS